MTLAFSTHINKKPTYFVQKIWQSIWELGDYRNEFDQYIEELNKRKISPVDTPKNYVTIPKIHTIRKDEKNRWKQENKIHFVINNRSANRFQFAPILPVKSVQKIMILYSLDQLEDNCLVHVYVDEEFIGVCEFENGEVANCSPNIEYLSKSDGFESVKDFFGWFNKDFDGKIIHWTNFKH